MRQCKPFPYTLDAAMIPSPKLLDITPCASSAVHVDYACPDACWREHHDEWCRQWRSGNKSAPQPMPWGHCEFERPTDYGMVPYGCDDPAMIRAAHDHHVRAMLNGWDRDLTVEQLDKIVNATVDARLAGQDLGGAPFMACIYANL